MSKVLMIPQSLV